VALPNTKEKGLVWRRHPIKKKSQGSKTQTRALTAPTTTHESVFPLAREKYVLVLDFLCVQGRYGAKLLFTSTKQMLADN
jgi:hypothetical protein